MRAVYIQAGKVGAALVHAGLLEALRWIGELAGGAAAIPANLQHRRATSRRDGRRCWGQYIGGSSAEQARIACPSEANSVKQSRLFNHPGAGDTPSCVLLHTQCRQAGSDRYAWLRSSPIRRSASAD